MKKGEIYFADLTPVIGSEQGGMRPVVIIQNDIGNKYSPTVIVAAITSKIQKAKMPTHVEISKKHGLDRDSVILAEQVRTIDKSRLIQKKVGELNYKKMVELDNAILISLGIQVQINNKMIV